VSLRVALYHNLPPGGALRVVREFVERAPSDVEVDVFSLDIRAGSPFPPVPILAGRNVGTWQEPLSAGRLGTALSGKLARPALSARLGAAEKRVAHQMNEGAYDVAYVHPCWLAHTPGLIRDLEIPSVLYLHEVRRATFEPAYVHSRPRQFRSIPGWSVDRLVDRQMGWRDRSSVAAADQIVCNSTYTAERILGCYGRTAEVLRPGVDPSVFHPTQASTERREPRVLSVGGLEHFKNHHVVVEALGRLPSLSRPRLGLVYERCDPSYRAALLAQAAELHVEVEEYQGIDDGSLSRLYSASLATVLAAQLEPLGLVALESIACGTPVVAVREAGYRETITDQVNGLLVPRSVEALSHAIDEVISGAAGLVAPEQLPRTILPTWSSQFSADRQFELLERSADD
jgi:glycosyltransferase involved in cell wall biosynthesis